MPLTGGLGEVPAACDEGAEEAGQAVVGQGGDGGRQDGLEDGPCGRLGAQVVLECGPHQAEVGKVGEEDGDEDVGHDPDDGQQADPAVVDVSSPPALLFRKVEVGPDQIALLGRQFDGDVASPAAVLVSLLVCFRDGGEGDESVGFGRELVPPATSFGNFRFLPQHLVFHFSNFRCSLLLLRYGQSGRRFRLACDSERFLQLSDPFVMLVHQLLQNFHIASDGRTAIHVPQPFDAAVAPEVSRDVGDEQGARGKAKAAPVVIAGEILSPQLEDGTIVAAEEEADDQIGQVRGADIGPQGRATVHVLWRQCGEEGDAMHTGMGSGGDVDADQKAADEECEGGEDVAHHSDESQKDGGIVADLVDHVGLCHPSNSPQPSQKPLTHRRRLKSATGMLSSPLVHVDVVGSNETEGQDADDADADVYGQSGQDGRGIYLYAISLGRAPIADALSPPGYRTERRSSPGTHPLGWTRPRCSQSYSHARDRWR